MKVFFFYIGTPTPIFETELELIRKHEKLGDPVRVLQCSGNLPNCHWNPEHKNSLCAMCRSKFKNGWEVLNPGKNVELKQFPTYKPMSSEFPPVFNFVDDITRYQYDNENIGYGVASSLISSYRDHRFNTRKYHSEIIRELSTAVAVYRTLKQELEEFKPDRVYFFNGRITTHLPAKLLCKRMGIEYFSYEVANKLNSYLLIKNATAHTVVSTAKVNLIISNWEMKHEKIGEAFFRQKRNGNKFENVLSFVKNQIKDILPKGFNRNKKNIAIFGGTIDEYAGVEEWKNKIYEPDETAGVRKILESFESDNRYMFYLRVHPHMKELSSTTSQLVDIRELSSRFNNLCVIWPGDTVDSYALMDACEKIITFGSTMGVEATYWGRPSILAGHAFYENFDCVYMPKTHEELVKLLEEDIKPLSVDSTLKYAFWEVSNGTPFEHFKQTGFKNGLAVGAFDGIEIKPSALSALWYKITIFPWRVKRVVMKPTLIFRKLKKYVKEIH
ncbi:MAG: hypothetical protein ABL923_00385 [Burkholderiaceae bacterium]